MFIKKKYTENLIIMTFKGPVKIGYNNPVVIITINVKTNFKTR